MRRISYLVANYSTTRVINRGAIIIPCVLVGFVATYDAASYSADHPMVARVVTCDTADDRAFDAPFG